MFETFEKMVPFVECQCPEPDRPGWMHRTPIECSPLVEGETIEEWRGRRYDRIPSVPYNLKRWHEDMEYDGWASMGRSSIDAATAEGHGHGWDRIVFGWEDECY
jgi:hypothetical protein